MVLPSSGPKTSHLSDPSLEPFIKPSFDPAAYLNATLPPVHPSSTPASKRETGSVALGDLSTQTNQLLSQLNAHASRLSNVLTQLTDDIIRSGARLAYEVEVLRGETTGLCDALNDTLKDDVQVFVPAGLSTLTSTNEQPLSDTSTSGRDDAVQSVRSEQQGSQQPAEPEYITRLRTLVHVRQRLESTINLFGEAMQWTLPSAEASSITSAFISVSPPPSTSAGVGNANQQGTPAKDEKAREFAAALRQEIADLIVSDPDGDLAKGHQRAMQRIDALRDLARVWKGTAEEKPRVRFVENLAKLADERVRELEREADGPHAGRFGTPSSTRRVTMGSRALAQRKTEKDVASGFLDNLYRLRKSGDSL